MRHYDIYGHVCATLESYISWISFSWCCEKVIFKKKKKEKTFHHSTKWFSENFGFCNVVEIRGSKILPKTKWFSPCLRKNSLSFLFFLFSCKSFLSNHGEVAQKNRRHWPATLKSSTLDKRARSNIHASMKSWTWMLLKLFMHSYLHGENLGLIKKTSLQIYT